jgi:hypothetical protein
MTFSPFGEKSLTLVAATFGDQQAAELAAAHLRSVPDLDGEVSVIHPGDPLAARKFEPDQRGIWRTMLRSHLVLGGVGALLGMGLALWLIAAPWQAATVSPGLTLTVAVVLGSFIGMMAGGLLTLRPDHGIAIRDISSRLKTGHWAVVVRPMNEVAAKIAFQRLEADGGAAVRSL